MDYEISDDPSKLDVERVHRWICEQDYSPPTLGRGRETMERAIEGSICPGAYARGGEQAGVARVVSDGATFAWLCDLFVFDEHRGHDRGKQLVEAVLAHPALAEVRHWILATTDAHDLYRRCGFEDADPERYMVLRR